MSEPVDFARAKAALGPVMDYIRDQLRASTEIFLARAEKLLTESWPSIDEFRKQDSTRYAASWLGRNKAAVQSAMHQRLIGALSAQYEPPPPEVTELHLMDGDTLAASLLRAKMVSRVMERGGNDLVALELRFEQLQKAGLALNPRALGPGALADGFLSVLKDLQVPEEVQVLLLDVYGEQGVQLMVEFYQGINRVLVENKVSPELVITNRRTITHSQRPGDTPPPASDPREQAMQSMMAQVSRGDWRPGLFRQLLDGQFSFGAPAGGGGPRVAMPTTGAAGATPSEAPPGLTPAQMRAIDHIEAISFELLGDERISPRIRTELSRLILPMLTAQVANPGARAADESAARVLVRELASLGYRDQELPISDFDGVAAMIERIVVEQGTEIESFRGGVNVLHTMLQKELERKLALLAEQERGQRESDVAAQSKAEAHSQRQAKTLAQRRAEARAEAARHHVAVELNDRAAGLEMDPAAASFALEMLGPWMIERLQRYGPGSTQWTEARTFATQFFDAARPAVTEADQARKQALRRRVIREARLRTQHTGISVSASAKLLGDLERYFQNLIVIEDAGAAPRRPASTVDFIASLRRPAAL